MSVRPIGEYSHADSELPLSAVEQQELWRVGEAGPVPSVTVGKGLGALGEPVVFNTAVARAEPSKSPSEDFVHGAVVIVTLDCGHFEPPVVASLRQPVLEDHHRADIIGALHVAHVVALDAKRRFLQPEGLLQFLDRSRRGS